MIRKLTDKLFWRTALAGAIVLCGYAYYLKNPSFREWVDAKAPQFKEFNGKLIARWSHGESSPPPSPSPPGAQAEPATAGDPETVTAEPPAPTPASVAVEPAPRPQAETVDLAQLSQSRQEWPKTVILKKEMEFPAVLNGKVMGSIKTPPGTQAHLLVIRDGRLGVEYEGGGAMVEPDDTDLIEQVLSTRHGHPNAAAPVAPVVHTASSTSAKPASKEDDLPGLGVDAK